MGRCWLIAAIVWAAPSLAAEPLAPLLACRSIPDTLERVKCYDRESARLVPGAAVASPAAAASPAAVPTTIPTAAPSPEAAAAPANTAQAAVANFGLAQVEIAQKEVAAGTRAADLNSIQAHIARVSISGAGVATFALDNGQVWEQLLAEGDLLATPGLAVKISRGAFHSYWLQLKTGRGCKVKRIR